MNNLKVLVISQDDKFAIPKNLERLVESDFIDVLGCILIDAKSTLNNKRKYFAKGFGLKQSFKMGLKILQFDQDQCIDCLGQYQKARVLLHYVL